MSERIHTDRDREDTAPPEEDTLPAAADADGDESRDDDREVESRLSAAEAKAAEHLDDLKRLAAEFDNYRKRTARDQARLTELANQRLVKELLPVLDDLERALEATKSPETPVRDSGPGEGVRGNRAEVPAADNAAVLKEGVQLVHRSLAELLRKEGLAEIETDGSFDPHVHEALLAQPSDAPEGDVLEVVQRGYRLGDLVLRPARVVVSAGEGPAAA